MSCHNGCKQPESASLFKTLQASFQQAGEFWIVIDAPDERHKRNDDLNGDLLELYQELDSSRTDGSRPDRLNSARYQRINQSMDGGDISGERSI